MSKGQDGDEDEEVEETPEDAGVEDDEDRDEVATNNRDSCSAGTESATRKHHQIDTPMRKREIVRLPHRWLGGRVDEGIVVQVDYDFRKTRPQYDLITTRVGVDDSFDSCETICVDVLCLKAIAILVRSMSQPRLIKTERWRTLDCRSGPTDV